MNFLKFFWGSPLEVVERLRGIGIASRMVYDAPSGLESFRAHPGVVIFSLSVRLNTCHMALSPRTLFFAIPWHV